jgi:hypothetical protein
VMIGGPRAVELTLAGGAMTSISVGPAYAQLGDRGGQVFLLGQHDGVTTDVIYANEGTDLSNRSGATGLTVIALA